MKRVFLTLLFILSTQMVCANSLYPFKSARQDAQFEHLLRELRCLVCQNQDLADSNAPLAIDLRDEVYDMVRTGQSDEEIVHYLTARYGDFILFRPPMKSATLFLWFCPIMFVILGLLLFWWSCLRKETQ